MEKQVRGFPSECTAEWFHLHVFHWWYICMFFVYIHTYLIDAVLVCLVMCIYICLMYFVLFICQWLARFLKALVANECLLVRTHSISFDIHSICSSFPPPSSPSCSVGQNGFFDLDAPWMAFNGDRKWRQTRTFPQHYIFPSGKHLWLIFRQALGVYVLLHPRCLFGPFWANFQFLCFTPSDLYLFLLFLLPWLRVNPFNFRCQFRQHSTSWTCIISQFQGPPAPRTVDLCFVCRRRFISCSLFCQIHAGGPNELVLVKPSRWVLLSCFEPHHRAGLIFWTVGWCWCPSPSTIWARLCWTKRSRLRRL